MGLRAWFAPRSTAADATGAPETKALNGVDGGRGWWPIIRESFAGAWQKNIEIKLDTVLTYSAVYRCISLISSDVAKMPARLVTLTDDGIWQPTENAAHSPVLRRPNHYQNRIQFFGDWLNSKLIHGNTYVLKKRDGRNVVTALYVLNPTRVKPLVSDMGEVYYQLSQDNLARQPFESLTVPASEIIHDRWNTIHHPLVGTSPIFACGLAATQGLRIQNNSANFFGNGSNPGGVLTAPGAISDETAKRLKAHWDANYSGQNAGKVAVLGDGLKFEPMVIPAADAQLIEQLKWSAETVCSVFGVPAYKAGVGAPPAYNNIDALGQQYYTDCLQIHIESIEECLDEGLGLTRPLGAEFDLDYLFRLDTATLVESEAKAVTAMIKAPNEARLRLNLPPVAGGEMPYGQHQQYPIRTLAGRALPAEGDPAEEVEPEPDSDPELGEKMLPTMFRAILADELRGGALVQ